MGGSSIDLARQFECQVTGVTLSPLQRLWATCASRWHGMGARTQFHCADAESVVERSDLWTRRVMRTWEICMQRVRRTGVGILGRIIDP